MGGSKTGLCVLRFSLGIVILIQAVFFVLPGAAHDFSRTHMPGFVRMILGVGEILGSGLLLIPQTVVRGAWLLVAVLGLYGVGNLVVYAAAAFAIAIAAPAALRVRETSRAPPGGQPRAAVPTYLFIAFPGIFLFPYKCGSWSQK